MDKTGFVKVVKPTALGEVGVTLPVDLTESENHLKTTEKVIREISQFLDGLGQGFNGSDQAHVITGGETPKTAPDLELVSEDAEEEPTRGRSRRRKTPEEAAEKEPTRGRRRKKPEEAAEKEPKVGSKFVDAWIDKHLTDSIGIIVTEKEPDMTDEEYDTAVIEELEANYIMDRYETLQELTKAQFLKWGETARAIVDQIVA